MKKSFYTLTATYSVIMLAILVVAVWILNSPSQMTAPAPSQTNTEHIYVYLTESLPKAETDAQDTTSLDIGWIVKEYDGRIGIFDREGVLLFVLDTYIKTLPEADKRLLGEGIVIETKGQLLSLIEDYTA